MNIKINKFIALGGATALAGLTATSPELATDPNAQKFGAACAAFACAASFGAIWKWAKDFDQPQKTGNKVDFIQDESIKHSHEVAREVNLQTLHEMDQKVQKEEKQYKRRLGF